MKLNKSLVAVSALALPFAGTSQIVGDNAYMMGEYIEVGIDSAGHEGTDDIAGSNGRGGASAEVFLGFVANPQMDGWVNYDGDYFTPGSPENGWGLEIMGTNYASNGMGEAEIPGSIADYTETVDSIMVTWEGSVASVDVAVYYRMKKTDLFYKTTVVLDNTTATAMGPIYYYRNLDPDNNQSIGWGFPTINTILCQPTALCDTAMVKAAQSNVWDNMYQFVGIGENWRAYYGGFTNRDGSDLWDGVAPFVQTVGSTITADQAIGLAYMIDTLAPGKAAASVFSFDTWFDTIAYPGSSGGGGAALEHDVKQWFKMYPNPATTELTIEAEGSFDYLISNTKGQVLLVGEGEESTVVELPELSKGTYFVKVRQDGFFRTQPLIIE